jgi:hypothetical protein
MKDKTRELLEEGLFAEIAEQAVRKRRILGTLLSLTFDANPLIAWRAVEAMGMAAERISKRNSEYIFNHLRKLRWLISDESGGICWYAPQAIAEIVSRRPEVFKEYVPLVASLINVMEDEDLDHFRPGILWAIGRIAPVVGEQIEFAVPDVIESLRHEDPQVRGTAVWCLGRWGKLDALSKRNELFSDEGRVELYENGNIRVTSVGELTREALSD